MNVRLFNPLDTTMPPLLISILHALLWALATIAIIGTALSILSYEVWWIRAFDFPRLQLAIMSLVSIIGFTVMWWPPRVNMARIALLIVLLISCIYQCYRIIPYTPLNQTMSADASYPDELDRQVSIVVVNVYMHNEAREDCVALIERISPDMVLALETDEAWIKALDQLSPLYPNRVAIPNDNTYGMVLYSRLPLHDTRVRYLVQDDVPSIRTEVRLPNGEMFTFYGLHPRPPSPQESDSSLPRDTELILIAREISERERKLHTVVAGDMNDVAWSDTTQLFLKLSGMFDPRIGRGLFNTFHANIPPLRVPLDHVFHSESFKLVYMRRLPDIHSDHFPIYVRLSMEPGEQNKKLDLKPEDVDLAREKMNRADMNPDALPDTKEQEPTRDVLEL